MTHQLDLVKDMDFLIAYLSAVVVLVGVLLFAVRVRDIQGKDSR